MFATILHFPKCQSGALWLCTDVLLADTSPHCPYQDIMHRGQWPLTTPPDFVWLMVHVLHGSHLNFTTSQSSIPRHAHAHVHTHTRTHARTHIHTAAAAQQLASVTPGMYTVTPFFVGFARDHARFTGSKAGGRTQADHSSGTPSFHHPSTLLPPSFHHPSTILPPSFQHAFSFAHS